MAAEGVSVGRLLWHWLEHKAGWYRERTEYRWSNGDLLLREVCEQCGSKKQAVLVYFGRRIRESTWMPIEGASPEVAYYVWEGLQQKRRLLSDN